VFGTSLSNEQHPGLEVESRPPCLVSRSFLLKEKGIGNYPANRLDGVCWWWIRDVEGADLGIRLKLLVR